MKGLKGCYVLKVEYAITSSGIFNKNKLNSASNAWMVVCEVEVEPSLFYEAALQVVLLFKIPF